MFTVYSVRVFVVVDLKMYAFFNVMWSDAGYINHVEAD